MVHVRMTSFGTQDRLDEPRLRSRVELLAHDRHEVEGPLPLRLARLAVAEVVSAALRVERDLPALADRALLERLLVLLRLRVVLIKVVPSLLQSRIVNFARPLFGSGRIFWQRCDEREQQHSRRA